MDEKDKSGPLPRFPRHSSIPLALTLHNLGGPYLFRLAVSEDVPDGVWGAVAAATDVPFANRSMAIGELESTLPV